MIYGIDLGTTNSCVAYINDFGIAEILSNAMGSRTTPSVVYFDPDNKHYTVGEIAKNGLVNDYQHTVSCIKRKMGKDYQKPTEFPWGLTPTEISARILKCLVTEANAAKDGDPCLDVVITCPAYFGTVEREQIKQAGEIAGLNVIRIINEPTAAAIAYGQKINSDKDKYVLVYDLGGGTFDVTLIRIRGKSFKVIVTGGKAELGGADWDRCLADKLLEQFNSRTDSSYSFENNPALLNHFLLLAENTKKNLSGRTRINANAGWEGKSTQIPVTRDDFDSWTRHLLEKTILTTRTLLFEQAAEKSFTMSEDTDILLVGGSTRMPQVSRRLNEEFSGFGCKILQRDPDECVAKGAAQIGDIIEEQEDPESSGSGTTFYDVTSKTYGTDTRKKNDSTPYVHNLIFANTTLPARGECTFKTTVQGQKAVSLKIFESNSADVIIPESKASVIDETHTLPLPPNLPQGTTITVRFEIDRQGVLHIETASDFTNINFEVKIKGIMSANDLEQAKEDLDASNLV